MHGHACGYSKCPIQYRKQPNPHYIMISWLASQLSVGQLDKMRNSPDHGTA